MKVSSNRLLYGFALMWCALIALLFWGLPAWLDEGITLVQLSGNVFEESPTVEMTGAFLRGLLEGDAAFGSITGMLYSTDVHPPLYYLAANLWSMVFGDSVSVIRLFSLVMGVAGCVWFFASIKEWKPTTRLLGLALLLSSPMVVFAVSNARGYGLALFLICLCGVLAHKIIEADASKEDDRVHRFFLFFLVAAFGAFATHYFTAMVLFGFFLFLLPLCWKNGKMRTIVSVFLVLIPTLLMSPFLLGQLNARPDQYAGFQGFWSESVGLLKGFMEGFWLLPSIGVFSVIAGVVGLGVVFYGLTQAVRHKNKMFVLHFCGLVSFLILCFLLFWSTDKTVSGSSPRYFVFAFPSFLMMLIATLGPVFNRLVQEKKQDMLVLGAVCVAIGLFMGPRAWMDILPFQAARNHSIDLALEAGRQADAMIIVPMSIWDGAHVFDRFDGSERVHLAPQNDEVKVIRRYAEEADTLVVLKAMRWKKRLQHELDKELDVIKECGFVETSPMVWRRDKIEPCPW